MRNHFPPPTDDSGLSMRAIDTGTGSGARLNARLSMLKQDVETGVPN